MYQALYRKYRPRTFSDVTGQEHITETLRRQIVSDRLSHAYLFVGTRGTGKTSCAKILSRAVNCLATIDGDPCNECKFCVGIENGSILDVLEIDAASNSGVDNVRALREEAVYSPAAVKKRVYIVDEVHMLSTAAFNALLKILEEPPEHLMFILATTEIHKVPATIMSRCQRFSFKRLLPATISARLSLVAEKEGLSLSAEAVEKLAALADGSMRDGLSLLDQCAADTVIDLQRVMETIGLAGTQELLRLANNVAGRDAISALSILDSSYKDGKDMAALLGELTTLVRDILVFKLSADSPLLSGSFSRTELSVLSTKLSAERLFSFLDVLREAVFGLSRGGSARLSAEMCLIRMCDERLADDNTALLARIARLEAVQGGAVNAECEMRNAELIGDDERRDVIEECILPIEESEDSCASGASDEESQLSTLNSQPSTLNSQLSTLNSPEGGFWSEILELIKDDIAVYAQLSDSTKVQAELQDSVLILRASNPFTAFQIESDMFSEPLKDAAKKVLGREIIIRVESGGGSEVKDKREKLDRLSEFEIIQFE